MFFLAASTALFVRQRTLSNRLQQSDSGFSIDWRSGLVDLKGRAVGSGDCRSGSALEDSSR